MANTSSQENDLNVYTKRNYTLIIVALVVNIVIIWLVFSWVIQSLVTSLLYVKLFDYYTTYIVILWLFNIYVAFKYVSNLDKRISLEKLLEAEKKWFDLKTTVFRIKDKDISLEEFLTKKEIEWEDFCYEKIVKDVSDEIKAFVLGCWNDYGKRMANVDYIPNLLIVLFIIAGLVSLLFWRISVNNFVSKYENKYKKIEYQIKDKEEKKYVRETTISKLEDLKTKYVTEFWTGSDVVKQIDEDINKLREE